MKLHRSLFQSSGGFILKLVSGLVSHSQHRLCQSFFSFQESCVTVQNFIPNLNSYKGQLSSSLWNQLPRFFISQSWCDPSPPPASQEHGRCDSGGILAFQGSVRVFTSLVTFLIGNERGRLGAFSPQTKTLKKKMFFIKISIQQDKLSPQQKLNQKKSRTEGKNLT